VEGTRAAGERRKAEDGPRICRALSPNPFNALNLICGRAVRVAPQHCRNATSDVVPEFVEDKTFGAHLALMFLPGHQETSHLLSMSYWGLKGA
jgi:hypothetical protein